MTYQPMGMQMNFFHDHQSVAFDVFRCEKMRNTFPDHGKSKEMLGLRLVDDGTREAPVPSYWVLVILVNQYSGHQ